MDLSEYTIGIVFLENHNKQKRLQIFARKPFYVNNLLSIIKKSVI